MPMSGSHHMSSDSSAGYGTRALFRLWGPQVQPADVSALLGLRPAYAHAPGERRNRLGQQLPHGMWYISSEQHVLEADPEAHITWILDQIEPLASQIDVLRGSHGTHVDIDCTAAIQGNGGVQFTPGTLGRIAAMKLPLGLTVHYV